MLAAPTSSKSSSTTTRDVTSVNSSSTTNTHEQQQHPSQQPSTSSSSSSSGLQQFGAPSAAARRRTELLRMPRDDLIGEHLKLEHVLTARNKEVEELVGRVEKKLAAGEKERRQLSRQLDLLKKRSEISVSTKHSHLPSNTSSRATAQQSAAPVPSSNSTDKASCTKLKQDCEDVTVVHTKTNVAGASLLQLKDRDATIARMQREISGLTTQLTAARQFQPSKLQHRPGEGTTLAPTAAADTSTSNAMTPTRIQQHTNTKPQPPNTTQTATANNHATVTSANSSTNSNSGSSSASSDDETNSNASTLPPAPYKKPPVPKAKARPKNVPVMPRRGAVKSTGGVLGSLGKRGAAMRSPLDGQHLPAVSRTRVQLLWRPAPGSPPQVSESLQNSLVSSFCYSDKKVVFDTPTELTFFRDLTATRAAENSCVEANTANNDNSAAGTTAAVLDALPTVYDVSGLSAVERQWVQDVTSAWQLDWFKKTNTNNSTAPVKSKAAVETRESDSASTHTGTGDTGDAKRQSVLGKAVSQRLNITINYFKKAFATEGGWPAFKRAILECRLNKDAINLLMDSVPDPDEDKGCKKFEEWTNCVAKVRNYHKAHLTVELLEDEEYVFYMSSIPDLHRRLQCMYIKECFDEIMTALRSKLHHLRMTVHMLLNHRGLRSVMQALLLVGNWMNEGTNLGDRHWMRLSTLSKAVEVRAKGPESKSLMYFLACRLGPVLCNRELLMLSKARQYSIVSTYQMCIHVLNTHSLVLKEANDAVTVAEATGATKGRSAVKDEAFIRRRRRSTLPQDEDTNDRFAEEMSKFANDKKCDLVDLFIESDALLKEYVILVTYLGDPETFLPIDRRQSADAVQQLSGPRDNSNAAAQMADDAFHVLHDFFASYATTLKTVDKEQRKFEDEPDSKRECYSSQNSSTATTANSNKGVPSSSATRGPRKCGTSAIGSSNTARQAFTGSSAESLSSSTSTPSRSVSKTVLNTGPNSPFSRVHSSHISNKNSSGITGTTSAGGTGTPLSRRGGNLSGSLTVQTDRQQSAYRIIASSPPRKVPHSYSNTMTTYPSPKRQHTDNDKRLPLASGGVVSSALADLLSSRMHNATGNDDCTGKSRYGVRAPPVRVPKKDIMDLTCSAGVMASRNNYSVWGGSTTGNNIEYGEGYIDVYDGTTGGGHNKVVRKNRSSSRCDCRYVHPKEIHRMRCKDY
eukprot:Lankesteria_metandrocarpae@DN5199_c0_g1_i1.p1